jgi:hypothetical protein
MIREKQRLIKRQDVKFFLTSPMVLKIPLRQTGKRQLVGGVLSRWRGKGIQSYGLGSGVPLAYMKMQEILPSVSEMRCPK